MSGKLRIMSVRTILFWLAGFVGLMVGITFLLYKAGSPTKVSSNGEGPIALVENPVNDIGEMKVDEEKQIEFSLSNTGVKPLKILKMSSSCNCTFGQFIYQGKTSAEYGMHAESGYLGEIAPGDKATIRMIYRPKIMPVYGPVSRDLYLTTNDPANPKLTLTLKATVE